MGFKANNPGCNCCGAADCGTLDFTVTVCGSPAVGAIVSVTGPSSFSASCTTDATGKCSVSIHASGSYPWTVTLAGTTGASGTKTVASCVAGSHNTVSVSLTAATGYSCTPDCCTGQSGPPYVPVTWPSTVFVNDGIGTVTCSLTLLSGNRPLWTGTATRTAASAFDCNFNNGTTVTCGKQTGVATPVTLYFTVNCGSTNGDLKASVGYYPCSNFTSDPGCAIAPGTCGQDDRIAVVGDTSCGCSQNAFNCIPANCCVDGAIGAAVAHGMAGTAAGGMVCPPAHLAASVSISGGTGAGSLNDTVVNSLAQIYGGPPVSITLTVTS